MNMPGMLINNPVCYIRAKIPGQFDPLFFDIENVKNRFLISKVEIIQPPPPPLQKHITCTCFKHLHYQQVQFKISI